MQALVFRGADGQPLSEVMLAAIAGTTQGQFGYTAELVIVPAKNGGFTMRTLLSFLAFGFFIFVGAVAFAQSPASLPSDIAGVIDWLGQTHKSGDVQLMIGGVLTLLLRFAPIVKPLLDKLPDESTKWVAGALAMIGSVATGLMGHVPWFEIVTNGAKVAVAAVGGWEFILKPLLKLFDKLKGGAAPTA